MPDDHRNVGMCLAQDGSINKLMRVQLEIKGHSEFFQKGESLSPRWIFQKITSFFIPRPGGFMVDDLPDSANPLVLLEGFKNTFNIRTLQRLSLIHI